MATKIIPGPIQRADRPLLIPTIAMETLTIIQRLALACALAYRTQAAQRAGGAS